MDHAVDHAVDHAIDAVFGAVRDTDPDVLESDELDAFLRQVADLTPDPGGASPT